MKALINALGRFWELIGWGWGRRFGRRPRVAINTCISVSRGDRMKGHTNTILALFALALMGMCIPLAAAQASGIQYQYSTGIATLETDQIQVKITGLGEVPHFQYWSPEVDTVDYHVMFVKLFEANDTDSDGVFTNGTDTMVGPPFALPTADWAFSGFYAEEVDGNVTAVHFNLTASDEFDPRPGGTGGAYGHLPDMDPFNVTIQLRVHIYVESSYELKFDVILSGWQWTSDDSILVMQFTVTQSAHGQNQGTSDPAGFYQESTKFKFGNGYMQYNDTALAAQNEIQVKASHRAGTGLEAGESIYLSFENFGNDTLVYDPTLGVEVSSTLPPDTNTLVIVGGVMAAIIIVAVLIKVRK